MYSLLVTFILAVVCVCHVTQAQDQVLQPVPEPNSESMMYPHGLLFGESIVQRH